jgi:citrate lyase synthetase
MYVCSLLVNYYSYMISASTFPYIIQKKKIDIPNFCSLRMIIFEKQLFAGSDNKSRNRNVVAEEKRHP